MDQKKISRRFFGMASLAPAVAAALPEQMSAAAIKPDPQAVYILTCDQALTEESYQRIQDCWREVFGPDAPKMLLLEGGLKLQNPNAPTVNITINSPGSAFDAESFENHLRLGHSNIAEAVKGAIAGS